MKTKVVCINLLRRPDRKAEVTEEFIKWGLDPSEVDFFEAVDNPENGMAGLHQTMINVFTKYAGQQILVFEDDVRLYFNKQYLTTVLSELVLEDWFLFYLGGNANAPTIRYGSKGNVYRVRGGFHTTHAILYSAEATTYLDSRFGMPSEVTRENTIDVWLSQYVQPYFPCYTAFPAIASQKWGYSDICKFETNYDYFYSKSLKFYK